MKKPVALSVIGIAAAGFAQAQEFGRVISSTPIVHQVAVPRQSCIQQPVAVEQPKSGAGSLMGAIAGGAMGNAVGDGSGRALATMIGLVGGAIVGDRIEGSNTQVQNYQQCSTQTYYENRTVGYDVTYEYADRRYQVQLAEDPGPTIRLQVNPVDVAPHGSPSQRPGAVVLPTVVAPVPVVMARPVTTIVTVPAPLVQPNYYRPLRPNVSLHLGYARLGHRHHWH